MSTQAARKGRPLPFGKTDNGSAQLGQIYTTKVSYMEPTKPAKVLNQR
jgi:hypothetical protein